MLIFLHFCERIVGLQIQKVSDMLSHFCVRLCVLFVGLCACISVCVCVCHDIMAGVTSVLYRNQMAHCELSVFPSFFSHSLFSRSRPPVCPTRASLPMALLQAFNTPAHSHLSHTHTHTHTLLLGRGQPKSTCLHSLNTTRRH